MGINFPNTPFAGQEFEIGGVTYIYNGHAWDSKTEVPQVITSEIPPADPKVGHMWYKTSTGVLYIWYDDGNSIQWVQVSAVSQLAQDLSLYTKKTAIGANRFMNPSMQVSQENQTNQMTTDLAYPADGCCFRLSGITGGTSYKTTNNASLDGTQTWVCMQTSTAKPSLAATDLLALAFPIESYDIDEFGIGTTSMPFIIRFSVMAGKLGTFGFAFVLPTKGFSYCGTFTVTSLYTPQRVVVQIPPISNYNASINSDNSLGAALYITGAAGANYVGIPGWQNAVRFAPPDCVNLAESAYTSCYVTDIGIYPDVDNTGLAPPFEHLKYAETLQTCMRYWEKSYEPYGTPGSYSSVGAKQFTAAAALLLPFDSQERFRVPKRLNPTMLAYNPTGGAANTTIRNDTAGTNVNTTGYTGQSFETTGVLSCSPALVAGNQYSVHWVANARLM